MSMICKENDGWKRYLDHRSGQAYYYKATTGESRWEDPPQDESQDCESLRWEEEEDRAPKRDYSEMARVYKQQRVYRVLTGSPVCVVCRRERCVDVLFPCEHKCVCRSCLGDFSAWCPLCCGEVKRVLPHDGQEREKYWDWVLAVRPRLPPDFRDNFEFAGAYLRHTDDPPSSCFCVLS